MVAKVNGSMGAAIKYAIEARDARMLSKLYTDDATLRVIDRNNPPSKPREVRGRNAISTFWDDICSRAMVHQVDINATEGDRLTFSQSCVYPGGAKVFCVALVELDGGKIAHQTIVQAWDE
jgi:ketosteroid isomerase-like protein